jgi:hypothetical protein
MTRDIVQGGEDAVHEVEIDLAQSERVHTT